ncbi:MAG: hypothetical protein ACREOI_05800 [bacterium]
MNSDNICKLVLSTLGEGLPAITPAFGVALAEAGAVCLEEQGHFDGVELKVSGEFTEAFKVYWPNVTDQMRLCWNDQEVTTEHGAYGMGMLLIRDLTDFSIIERSRKGAGFDFWLGYEDELPFQNKARLEISGIRKGDDSTVKARVQQKLKQTERSKGMFPAYIVVVEFSKPLSHVVKR